MQSRGRRFGAALAAAFLLAAACAPDHDTPPPAPASEGQAIGWRPLGTWSGQGDLQTESFVFDGGVMRVRWETTSKTPNAGGTFNLTLHSAVSGRPIGVITEHEGPGKGEVYIPEEPRPTYAIVESDGLVWSFTVEEGRMGTAVGSSGVEAP
jgi:hypothetical protein